MAASINADNGVVSGSAGLKSTADSTGVLALQTNGTTAVSISAAQAVSFTNPITGALNGTVGATTPSTGAFTTVSATSSISASNSQNAVSTLATFNNNTQGTGAVTEVYLTDNTTGTMRFNVFSGSYTTTGLFDYASGAKIFHSGSGGLSVGASGGNLTLFSGSNSAVLSSTGLKTATTISVGNATPSTSGAGITFPATQSASSNANTLDDYEEGTFTPTQNNFVTTGTVTITGRYVKVGSLVHFNVKFESTGTISYGTSAFIDTPFPVKQATGNITMRNSPNSTTFNSNQGGAQCTTDEVGASRFFVGSFTATSAGQILMFAGTFEQN